MKHVIILGGGVGGMSAAHELIERGYKVTIFERQKYIPGGKARSVPVPNTSTGDRKDLPGEHGFRFFPGFYRHITDTMSKIPFKGNRKGVLDNLVPTHTIMMARYDDSPIITLDDFPTSLQDLEIIIKAIAESETVGLKDGEAEFFAKRVWQLMTSCHDRRVTQYERMGWWEFLEADRHSEAYKTLFVLGLTRSLVAAKAELASTKTVGDIFIQLVFNLLDAGTETDRVLNGPTNERWIDPWLDYLKSKGVTYHFGHIATEILTEGEEICGVKVRNEFDGTEEVHTADHYISAVPVERMAKLITPKLKKIDATLEYIEELGENNVSWMNGIQFFLKKQTNINHGHVIYLNSQWALTSISQKQFWDPIDLANYGNGETKDVLSVDISDWDEIGLNGKTAKQCTKEEIIEEVWKQLKKSLHIDGKEVLKDDDVVTVYLDSDIKFDVEKSSTGILRNKVTNEEPLLVNFVNTWTMRPAAYTRVENLYLASDYVRTNTDLASMEGANEAARRAVNCILDKDHSRARKCEVWDLHEPLLLACYRWNDNRRYKLGLPFTTRLPWFMKIAIWFMKHLTKIKRFFLGKRNKRK